MLVTDFEKCENTPMYVLDLFTDANRTRWRSIIKHNVLSDTDKYILGRGRDKPKVVEEEDVCVPGSAALAGKMILHLNYRKPGSSR
jgi:hypothetical protein